MTFNKNLMLYPKMITFICERWFEILELIVDQNCNFEGPMHETLLMVFDTSKSCVIDRITC